MCNRFRKIKIFVMSADFPELVCLLTAVTWASCRVFGGQARLKGEEKTTIIMSGRNEYTFTIQHQTEKKNPIQFKSGTAGDVSNEQYWAYDSVIMRLKWPLTMTWFYQCSATRNGCLKCQIVTLDVCDYLRGHLVEVGHMTEHCRYSSETEHHICG